MWTRTRPRARALRTRPSLTVAPVAAPTPFAVNPAADTRITTFANGLRVATQDAPGHFVTFGVYVDTGSRFETQRTAGCTHVLDRLAFKSTENYTSEQIMTILESLGGNVMAHSSRENISYQAAVFPQDLPQTVKLLAEVVRRPMMLPEEIEEVKDITRFEIAELEWKMDAILPERLHAIAFGGGAGKTRLNIAKKSPWVNLVGGAGTSIVAGVDKNLGNFNTLGRPLICDVDTLAALTPELIREYHTTWYTPDRMVIAGVGMPHEELVDLVHAEFGDMEPAAPEVKNIQRSLTLPAEYSGGIVINDTSGLPVSPNPDDKLLTYVHIAFEAPSMSDPDIYALATLSTLMGGGGSFSAGGPGKGMYTRLFTQVLNKYHWVENCNMASFSYVDTGLFGISAAVPPSHQTHEHIGPVLCDQLYRMTQGFSREELSRAKNQLKSNLLMSLESRSVELEDVARQVMVHGRRIGVGEMCRRVDLLTETDLVRVAERVVMGKEIKSPLKFGEGDEDLKHWSPRAKGAVTALVHGQLQGGAKDPLSRLDALIHEWSLGSTSQ